MTRTASNAIIENKDETHDFVKFKQQLRILHACKNKSVKKEDAWVGAFLCPILFSGCVELLQEYCTTYRGGDWLDFAANSVGAILASLVAYYVVRPRMMRRE